MDFADPRWLWWTLAAPAAAVVAWLLWRRRLRDTAAWAARGLWDRLLPSYRPRRLVASSLLFGAALAGLTLALARPRWGTSEQRVERKGVDLVFVLDTSLSMATRDVQPSRLWVAQSLIRRLVARLGGSRVALVQAEGGGMVMAPLTLDQGVIDLLLDAVAPGSLPSPGTELAPALATAADLYPEGSEKHRVMVVVSDGEDHGGGLERAIERLRDLGVVVHAIGVGTPEGQPLELPGEHPGERPDYKHDADGNIVVSHLVEKNLEQLARSTGGVYLRATSAAVDPAPLAERIEQMETRSFGSEVVNNLEERFQWPLGAAAVALGLQLLLAPFRPPRREST